MIFISILWAAASLPWELGDLGLRAWGIEEGVQPKENTSLQRGRPRSPCKEVGSWPSREETGRNMERGMETALM